MEKYKLDYSDLKYLIEDALEDEEYILKFNNYQALTAMYMSPNTSNRRILLKWDPGVGKTIGVLGLAKRFLDVYKQTPEIENTIFVIGFTQEFFKRELLRFPSFGFATRDEIKQLKYYEKTDDDAKYNELFTKLSRRLTTRKDGGYFQFIGYKAFVSRIFNLENSKIDIDKFSEDEFRKAVKTGDLQFNRLLLSKFKNALLICDEIHNVWNAQEKNNWGIALQLLLDVEPSIKAVFLSATPIGNNPTEIIDMMNLLLEPKEKLARSDLFDTKGSVTQPGLIKLAKACQGKISYVIDYSPEQYARQVFMGNPIKDIPFLKFIRCPMSALHYNTYKQKFTGSLMHDSQYLMDAVFPSSTDKTIGVFSAETIKKTYSLSSEEWKSEVGLRFQDGTITGPGLEISRLKLISSKFYAMMQNIFRLIPMGGNISVYHGIVHITGVLFIEQILQYNGIISTDQAPTADTICNICGKKQSEHKPIVKTGGCPISNDVNSISSSAIPQLTINQRIVHVVDEKNEVDWDALLKKYSHMEAITTNIDVNDEKTIKHLVNKGFKISDKNENFAFMQFTPTISGGDDVHEFIPVRYIIAHGDMDRSAMARSLAKYNSVENVNGNLIRILLGSKIMKEGWNVNNPQHILIMSRPDSIPRLIQILGRYRRKNGHNALPVEKRVNNIYIYTTCLPNGDLSYDEERYKEKAILYKDIQKIEKVLNENAFDGPILFVPRDLSHELFAPLPYTPAITKKINESYANDIYYRSDDVNNIIYMIKRLYMDVSIVWTYQTLFAVIKHMPFKMQENTQKIQEENFVLALHFLLSYDNYNLAQQHPQKLVDVLYNDTDQRLVLRNGRIGNLRQIGQYLVFVTNGLIEPEITMRMSTKPKNNNIDVYDYVKNISRGTNYSTLLVQFKVKYGNATFEDLMIIAPKYGGLDFHERLVEDVISYIVGIYTDPAQKKSEFHELFNKMLYYYNTVGLVMWASDAPEYVQEQYKQFIVPFKSKPVLKPQSSSHSGTNFNEIHNIAKTRELFAQSLINTTKALVSSKRGTNLKVNANSLPVGHFIKSAIPMIYDPIAKKWNKDTKYSRRTKSFKENDIIIGYHEKVKGSVEIKFKIRSPFHLANKSSDARKNKKGSACTTNQKWRLIDILQQLGVAAVSENNNLTSLCTLLETTLINKEVDATTNKTGIKWFYFFWEDREFKIRSSTSTSPAAI